MFARVSWCLLGNLKCYFGFNEEIIYSNGIQELQLTDMQNFIIFYAQLIKIYDCFILTFFNLKGYFRYKLYEKLICPVGFAAVKF